MAYGIIWLCDQQKLPPPKRPPPLLPPPLPPPLLALSLSPLPLNLHNVASIPCPTREARAGLFACSSYFSSIVLGYEHLRSNSLETWVVAQGAPNSGVSEYRRFRHKEDFPDDLSHTTTSYHGIVLQQNLSITPGDFSCKGNIGDSGGGPEIVEDLMISVEGSKVDEKLGYAKTYTKLRWDRDFGPYFHDPPFTVTPKVVQLHQTSGGKGLTVSSIVRLLQWQIGKKQHEKFEPLDPCGDLQAGISVNQFLEVDETLVLLDCQIEDDESTKPEFEAKGNRPSLEPNGEVQDISTECVWFERVPKRVVEKQFNDIEVVEIASESSGLKPSPDPLSVGIYREHFDGDIEGKKGNIKRFLNIVDIHRSCEVA